MMKLKIYIYRKTSGIFPERFVVIILTVELTRIIFSELYFYSVRQRNANSDMYFHPI